LQSGASSLARQNSRCLLAVKKRPQQLPPVPDNPHGAAGDLSYHEAVSATRGGGASDLDKMEF